MNTRTTFFDEFSDRCFGRRWLEQFNQRLTCGESGDSGAVGVVKRGVRQAEYVAKEGQKAIDTFHGDTDVRDSGWSHQFGAGVAGASGTLWYAAFISREFKVQCLMR